mgnify:FL=1
MQELGARVGGSLAAPPQRGWSHARTQELGANSTQVPPTASLRRYTSGVTADGRPRVFVPFPPRNGPAYQGRVEHFYGPSGPLTNPWTVGGFGDDGYGHGHGSRFENDPAENRWEPEEDEGHIPFFDANEGVVTFTRGSHAPPPTQQHL